MRKKKILFHSDNPMAKTGFGRNLLTILKYLYKTGKYDIEVAATGTLNGDSSLDFQPWKTTGVMPNDEDFLRQIDSNDQAIRSAGYGVHLIDQIIKESRPDIYICINDFWGQAFNINKNWFNQINSVLWTTLDSRPIMPAAIDAAPKLKNFWIWSDFATKEFHKVGCDHVKTLHGAFDTSNFYKLSESRRRELRERSNISCDDFIIGFVFRNQLRKSVPNLLEGYSLFKKQNPEIKNTKLLLHTHFGEGWDIDKFAGIYNLDSSEILTTYICKSCHQYEVKNYDDRTKEEKDSGLKKLEIQDKDCKFCEAKRTQITCNVGLGVTEEHLNEIYNLMNCYIHPFTSGGQEMPIQEAKLTELVTLVTNYSCGEEMNYPEAGSLPLDYHEYIEGTGSDFIKASTSPRSIAKQLLKIYKMKANRRAELGALGRQWVINNCDINKVVGPFLEEFFDSCDYIDETNDNNFKTECLVRKPDCEIPEITDSREWILYMYANILGMLGKSADDKDVQDWMSQLDSGVERGKIEAYFRGVARQELQKESAGSASIIDQIAANLNKDDQKRVLVVVPESLGDCIITTSLFKSIRNRYKKEEGWSFYVASKHQYREVFYGNENIDGWIPYHQVMDSQMLMEDKLVTICYNPTFSTQKLLNYCHGAQDTIDFDLNL